MARPVWRGGVVMTAYDVEGRGDHFDDEPSLLEKANLHERAAVQKKTTCHFSLCINEWLNQFGAHCISIVLVPVVSP